MRKLKDSGVEWIGKIPIDWNIKRIKAVLCERNESNNPIQTDKILSLTNDRGVIPYDEKGDVGNKSKEDLTGYKLAYPGDIVLNSMNVFIGSVGLSSYFGCVSPVYYMLYPRNKNHSVSFFNYLFQTKELQAKLHGYGNGIMEIRMRIQMSKLNSVQLPVPPSDVQQRIAAYLDRKCSQIDAIITRQQEVIERLKSYKLSKINEIINSENKTITNTTKTSLQDNIKSSSVQNNVTTTENNSAENKSVTAPIQNTFTAAKSFNNVIVNPSNAFATNSVDSSTQIEKATVINGQVYERSDVLNALTKKYGASAEKVLSAIEKDPGFIDLMKQYNGNQVIINALVEDPYLITKIKKAGGSLSINEIADIVKLCTDATSTDVMLEALENYSPAEAMKITRKSKIFNMKDDALSILSKSGSSVTSKKNQIEELCFSGGRRTERIG